MMMKQEYVDNGVGGGFNTVVEKLMGEVKMPDRCPSHPGTVSQIMSQGGFSIKYTIKDEECRKEVLEKLGVSIPGMP